MKKIVKSLTLFICAALMLLAVACGGNNNGDGGESGSNSTAQQIEAINAAINKYKDYFAVDLTCISSINLAPSTTKSIKFIDDKYGKLGEYISQDKTVYYAFDHLYTSQNDTIDVTQSPIDFFHYFKHNQDISLFGTVNPENVQNLSKTQTDTTKKYTMDYNSHEIFGIAFSPDQFAAQLEFQIDNQSNLKSLSYTFGFSMENSAMQSKSVQITLNANNNDVSVIIPSSVQEKIKEEFVKTDESLNDSILRISTALNATKNAFAADYNHSIFLANEFGSQSYINHKKIINQPSNQIASISSSEQNENTGLSRQALSYHTNGYVYTTQNQQSTVKKTALELNIDTYSVLITQQNIDSLTKSSQTDSVEYVINSTSSELAYIHSALDVNVVLTFRIDFSGFLSYFKLEGTYLSADTQCSIIEEATYNAINDDVIVNIPQEVLAIIDLYAQLNQIA